MEPWLQVRGDWRRPDDTSIHELFWCSESEFGQLFPRPTPDQVGAFYELESYYTHRDVQASRPHLRLIERLKMHLAWRADQGMTMTADYLSRLSGSASLRICDIGCGHGALLEQLQSRGHKVTGVEPDCAARKVASRKTLTIHEGTAEALPDVIREQHFDVVIMSHVLEHCIDPAAALSNGSKLLSPNGVIVVETPNNRARGLKVSGVYWRWLDVPRHLNFFTDKSLALMCEVSDLCVLKTEYAGYCRQFTPNWIEDEYRISQQLEPYPNSRPQLARRNWWLLLNTMFAHPSRKYDSVRIIAGIKS